jgi:hypothetical protein
MVSIAFALLYLAIAGAVAAWIAGAVFFVRTLAALGQERPSTRWLAIFTWPFAVSRLNREAKGRAAATNKAMVAFLACVLIAGAAISAGSNLQRVSSNAATAAQK